MIDIAANSAKPRRDIGALPAVSITDASELLDASRQSATLSGLWRALLVLAKPSSPTLASLAPVRDVYGDRTAAAIRPRRGRIGCIALDRRPFTATRSCRAPGAWRLARRPPNLAADVRSVGHGPVAAAKEGVDRGAGQTAEARPRTVLR